jgi:inositol transport system ATP-binding protein
MMAGCKLRVERLGKSFPGVKALEDVNLAVRAGTVHAICGENGAGKSTLMKVIIGIHQPDAGQILIDEQVVTIRNPIHARHHGISMIFQELSYIPEMTVEESFFVGNWPTRRLGRVNWKDIRARATDLLREENLPYSPKTKLKDLSVSDIQMLEIVKAIAYDSDILIMDEPTSAITANEAEALFGKIGELKARGKSILYISHKMEEIFRIADDITVLRDGCVIDSRRREDYDAETLITQMVGRPLESVLPQEAPELGAEALRVEGLSRAGEFEDIGFAVRAGEIVGFAGLVGAGRTEVLRALFGLDRADRGEIRIKGRRVAITTTADSIRNRMVMLSEDRKRYGIVPVRNVRENVALSNLRQFIFGGRLHAEKEIAAVGEICQRLNVKAPSVEATAGVLSGGNQQKVLFARWLLTEPEILLLDEPTRGIDVGAKQEIYRLMRALARQGKAVVMVSSELPELIMLCDRIYVMARGRMAGMLKREEFSQEAIMSYATGVNGAQEARW